MPSVLRTLLRPRWIVLVLAVALLVVVFLELSQWQLRRLDERRSANAVIMANEDDPPVPIERLVAAGEPVAGDEQWRRVTATGHYDTEHQVLVRYRPLHGEPGFHVLAPLVTARGPALLVDRGWIPTEGSGALDLPDPPRAPTGTVTVTGRLRVSERGDPDQVRPRTGQVRYINVPVIADALPYPVYGGYVELITQDPPAGRLPRPLPPPALDEGPHLSYAVQWVIFAVIAVGGVGFLAFDAATDGRLRERLRARELARSRQRAPAPPP